MALPEVGLPWKIDEELNTAGQFDYNGRLSSNMPAHPKSDGGHDHFDTVFNEIFLEPVPLFAGEIGMVGARPHTMLDQFSAEFIDLSLGDAVDDPRLTLVSTNDLGHLPKQVRATLHSINQVGPIKRTNQHFRLPELQLPGNIFPDLR